MKKFITKMTLKVLVVKENMREILLNEKGFTHISEVGGMTIAVVIAVIAIAAAAGIYIANTFLPNLWGKINGLFN